MRRNTAVAFFIWAVGVAMQIFMAAGLLPQANAQMINCACGVCEAELDCLACCSGRP
uniref:Uncharacterized protein n=1 Tax=Oryza brachyantha TaxID=4533 RepID=J3NAD1_ORYBR